MGDPTLPALMFRDVFLFRLLNERPDAVPDTEHALRGQDAPIDGVIYDPPTGGTFRNWPLRSFESELGAKGMRSAWVVGPVRHFAREYA
jgi:hypothetical protein